jgi:transposase
LRLVEQPVADGERLALACYGVLVRSWPNRDEPTETLWLRFVEGSPVSAVTIPFLAWCLEQVAATGKTALLLVWDNATWHRSQAVRTWIAAHNAAVRAGETAVRIVPCPLPTQSPWLNPIEPLWVHGKRRIIEPARLLSLSELETRVCTALDVAQTDHLVMPEQVA